ncbi:sugar ABC transporter permease [Curtobacterium sp. MCBD17_013]|uniref:carbohydrate ABC transporter permease n=1 Tax=Curtobacterium sp. MCBD17_013 TaxID=2175668 RepID=UPI000DA85AF8|nr:sugar ABC transporter permease [Curtobacterium sp. MCBD17_013]PZF59059.1 sugar ABC transporter permease [Curtobacterium sp. MCBD17_013]
MRTRNGGAVIDGSAPSSWFVIPALAMFLAFAIIPLVIALGLSFTSWDGLTAPVFNGIRNWITQLGDPLTYHALWLTLQVIVISWVIQTPMSVLVGVFVSGKQRYRAVLAALYFLPLILSSAAIAIAFKALLDPNYGVGHAFGLPALSKDWLGSPATALYVVIFVIAWQFIPFHSLLYQAGARQIPASLYEASQIDGAGRVRQFFSITLPQLRNTIITSSTLMIVGSLTYFDIVYVLTQGGPGYATRILPLDMYLTGFSASDLGDASVLAVILVVIGLVIALALTRFSGFNRMTSEQEGA